MKTTSTNNSIYNSRQAYTLPEVLIAAVIGSVLAGTVLLLLCQTATEQRYGLSDMTVEERAYILRANITSCLRSMSANQGVTPANPVYDNLGNLLGYQSIFIFYPANGAYITGEITYNAASGEVLYYTNILTPSIYSIWMSNNATATLTEFFFSTSYNLDGSQNNSLVNVMFQMNDNGFSQQGAVNNPTSICRNFSVQMRNDN